MMDAREFALLDHIDDGFAIEFMRLQHPDFVEENVTGE
jgi:hypothetical protein